MGGSVALITCGAKGETICFPAGQVTKLTVDRSKLIYSILLVRKICGGPSMDKEEVCKIKLLDLVFELDATLLGLYFEAVGGHIAHGEYR